MTYYVEFYHPYTKKWKVAKTPTATIPAFNKKTDAEKCLSRLDKLNRGKYKFRIREVLE